MTRTVCYLCQDHVWFLYLIYNCLTDKNAKTIWHKRYSSTHLSWLHNIIVVKIRNSFSLLAIQLQTYLFTGLLFCYLSGQSGDRVLPDSGATTASQAQRPECFWKKDGHRQPAADGRHGSRHAGRQPEADTSRGRHAGRHADSALCGPSGGLPHHPTVMPDHDRGGECRLGRHSPLRRDGEPASPCCNGVAGSMERTRSVPCRRSYSCGPEEASFQLLSAVLQCAAGPRGHRYHEAQERGAPKRCHLQV